jgi:hypothetical protein
VDAVAPTPVRLNVTAVALAGRYDRLTFTTPPWPTGALFRVSRTRRGAVGVKRDAVSSM